MIIAYKNIIRNTAQTSINHMYSKIVRNDNEFVSLHMSKCIVNILKVLITTKVSTFTETFSIQTSSSRVA